VRSGIVHRLSETARELFAAVAVGDAAAAHLREAPRDQLEHLVADVVPMGVVEFLEMVDVHHRDRVAPRDRLEALVERAPARQAVSSSRNASR
jgi:hypothetical protein